MMMSVGLILTVLIAAVSVCHASLWHVESATQYLKHVQNTDYKNVYDNNLESCSSDGMALTGYTRTGYCVDQNDDSGSHHICIALNSTTGGNFCTVTGQDDWCSSSKECHEDENTNCPVEHWCVCQWAFASYIKNAGGCDKIQTVVCNAVNKQALLAYQEKADND